MKKRCVLKKLQQMTTQWVIDHDMLMVDLGNKMFRSPLQSQ